MSDQGERREPSDSCNRLIRVLPNGEHHATSVGPIAGVEASAPGTQIPRAAWRALWVDCAGTCDAGRREMLARHARRLGQLDDHKRCAAFSAAIAGAEQRGEVHATVYAKGLIEIEASRRARMEAELEPADLLPVVKGRYHKLIAEAHPDASGDAARAADLNAALDEAAEELSR